MKKILFFAVIAAVALASCSQSESVDQTNGKAIAFDTYIGKATKGVPVSGTAFIDGATMAVYSTKDGALDMNNVTVTRTTGAWVSNPAHFYVKDAKYRFAAFSPAPAPAGVDIVAGTTSYTVDADIAKQVDFMYAPITMTDATWDGLPATVMAPITFAFKHALSQVKFSAKSNGDFSAMYTVTISNITVKQVNSVGTLTTATDTWSASTTPIDYIQPVGAFTLTHEMKPVMNAVDPLANNVLMFIPQTWTAELDVEVTLNVVAISAGGGDAVNNGEHKITAKIPASTWERNKIYNYQMNLDLSTILNLKEITFGDPSIEEWTPEEIKTPIVNPIP